MSHLQIFSTVTEAEDFLGPNFTSPCATGSEPRWWRTVERMRPGVEVRYLGADLSRDCRAVIPVYLHPAGKHGDRYSPDWGTISDAWPADHTDEPWAILGSCSGLCTCFAYTGHWSEHQAAHALLPQAIQYLRQSRFNVSMKYFSRVLRDSLADALRLPADLMPLTDTHAVLGVSSCDRDTYVASLREPFRTTVRRDMRRYCASGLQTEHTDLRSVMHELPRLWDQVEVHHGAKPDIALRERMLQAQCDLLNNISHVFSARDASGSPVAICLNYRFGKVLFCRHVGLDYQGATPSGAYFETMYYAPLIWAARNGITKLYLGSSALKPKVTRGATLEPLYSLYLGIDGRTLSRTLAAECTERVCRSLTQELQKVSRKGFRWPKFLI